MSVEAPADRREDTAGQAVVDEGAALIARHLAGDTRAFAALVRAFRAPVYGYLLRSGLTEAVADDLFQETFMRVHQHASRYQGDRPFRAWLFTIATNLVRSHHRKRKVRRVMTGWWQRDSDGTERALDPPGPAPDPEARASARQELAWLRDALAVLPESQRDALLLTKVEGLSLEETAAALNANLSTVKTWVRRGRMSLAKARAAQLAGGAV